jgi:hypothetical protein
MFGGGGSSTAPPLIDRANFDAVANLISIVRNPGEAQEQLERLLQASADAKQQQDQLHAQRSALLAEQESVRQTLAQERSVQDQQLAQQREALATEVQRRTAALAEKERAAEALLEQATKDGKASAALLRDLQSKQRRVNEIMAA